MNIPFSEIERGVPFLTVNKRLARAVRNRYDLHMKEKGLNVWESPLILPLLSWVRELWTDHSPEKFPLSPFRSRILWERIISGDKLLPKDKLLSGSEVALTAYDAYRLLKEYNLDLNDDLISSTRESLTLQRWSSIYENQLKELQFIDFSQLPFELKKLIESDEIKLPEKVIVAGFDEFSPVMKNLLATLEEKHCKVSFWPSAGIEKGHLNKIPQTLKEISIFPCTDEDDEVLRAARWIRSTYRKGMKLGVLAPDLHRYRNKILSTFNEELAPLSVFPWLKRTDLFNVSLGTRLYDEPVVRSAIDLLSLDEMPKEMDHISSFLLSPYLAFSREEQIELARLDAKLRRDNRFTLTIMDIHRTIVSGSFKVPLFSVALEQLLKWNRGKKGSLLPGEWSELFSALLKKVNWPANAASLDSLEYQALQSLGETLSSLAGLDDITGPVHKKDAIRYLSKIVKETIFQAESEDSPISVMGFLESAGMNFDALWLLGAHDGLFPGQPSPNPFIPLKVQKENGLPRSTFERELEFSKIQLHRILASTESIIFSFPERIEDRDVNISPLISFLESCRHDSAPLKGNRLIDQLDRLSVNSEEELLFNLQVREGEAIKGGTAILKNQSDCPFRAFAIHRLGSRKPEDPEPGISALERGSVIHKALEYFWRKVIDYNTLIELDKSGALNEIIAQSARAGLGLLNGEENDIKNYINIELERLSSLLGEWIQLELKRSPFKAMESESEKSIHLAGLPLSSRIDRIDRINDQSMAIIDYKTGSVSTGDWAGERPREPQLMLYASAGNYDAVLFARLKRGECRFTGIAKEEGLLPGIKAFTSDSLFKKNEQLENWQDLMEDWKKTLEGLANNFLNGQAHVGPRDYLKESSSCKYCHHMLLCRIFEKNYSL